MAPDKVQLALDRAAAVAKRMAEQDALGVNSEGEVTAESPPGSRPGLSPNQTRLTTPQD